MNYTHLYTGQPVQLHRKHIPSVHKPVYLNTSVSLYSTVYVYAHMHTHFVLHRDADETKEWIEEKNQALNTDNFGHDLASVQALQRKHEGFERDLAALGDKVSAGHKRLTS